MARAVGPGEVKQIYKCIEISIQHLTSFMGGQIGLQLKDLLFGVDGIPFSIPRGIANFNMTTQFPHVQSHGKRIVTGKREKKSLRPFNKNSTAHMKRQSGKGKQVEQAVLVETSLAKRMRTDEGWADGNAAVGYEARGVGVGEFLNRTDGEAGEEEISNSKAVGDGEPFSRAVVGEMETT